MMTSLFTSMNSIACQGTEHSYAMEDAVIPSCGDTDSLFPPLDPGTVRKINSTNALVENRYKTYRNQLQKEEEEAKVKFFVKRQDFVRSSIVLQERKRRLASKKKSLLLSGDDRKESLIQENLRCPVHTLKGDSTTRENGSRTRENSLNVDSTSPLRPPFFLPPLHKNIIIELKDAKEQKERQETYWKLNEVKLEDLQSCRYLRLAGRAKFMFDLRENEDGLLSLKINKSSSSENGKP